MLGVVSSEVCDGMHVVNWSSEMECMTVCERVLYL